ncbi:hypothetical protein [Acinetobacter chinensis]|jgi:hypothetical protein|uniref:hypothetical protein n=1 Tax=Acinetobacter chinensis TaxID=2004650 RepID=UPI0029345ABC|nr:hypothetical protein [Acinetobacter chinensis]WOE42396.1 hypothetical protein QSG87_04440 [Acinetobacter chinensis]
MTKLKDLKNKQALTLVSKHCQSEASLWSEIEGLTIEATLKGYFNLTIHLLCVLSEERAKLERLNKNEIQ